MKHDSRDEACLILFRADLIATALQAQKISFIFLIVTNLAEIRNFQPHPRVKIVRSSSQALEDWLFEIPPQYRIWVFLKGEAQNIDDSLVEFYNLFTFFEADRRICSPQLEILPRPVAFNQPVFIN